MKSIIVLAFALFAYTNFLDAQQQADTIKVCYGNTCPSNTTYCLKTLNTTADDQDIITEVDCLDANFTTTARFNGTRTNIFSPVLSFEGFTLSTVSEIPANNTTN